MRRGALTAVIVAASVGAVGLFGGVAVGAYTAADAFFRGPHLYAPDAYAAVLSADEVTAITGAEPDDDTGDPVSESLPDYLSEVTSGPYDFFAFEPEQCKKGSTWGVVDPDTDASDAYEGWSEEQVVYAQLPGGVTEDVRRFADQQRAIDFVRARAAYYRQCREVTYVDVNQEKTTQHDEAYLDPVVLLNNGLAYEEVGAAITRAGEDDGGWRGHVVYLRHGNLVALLWLPLDDPADLAPAEQLVARAAAKLWR